MRFLPSSSCVHTTIWMHHIDANKMNREKKLNKNYTKILCAILNKSKKQDSTKQQLYSHQSPISETTEVRCTRHVEPCWRSKDKLISKILLWIPAYGHANIG